mmetsp:Transcript_8914/g.31594  ORF Transcript_8914/g.31594 Transcript_8914/m.31594 type:complete len:238 (+) Transcript_8914:303-1016(+)
MYRTPCSPVRCAELCAISAFSLLELEDACCSHTGPDAHGHDAVLAALPSQLGQQRGDLPRASAAQRVSQRDGTAFRVDLVHRNLEMIDCESCLGGEGLVDLKNVDVLQLQPGLLQCDWYGVHRPNAHDLRIHTHDRKASQPRQNGQSQLCCCAPARDQRHRRTVGDLARVARGRGASLLEGGLHLREALHGDAFTRALVFLHHDLRHRAVLPLHRSRQRHDLGVEEALRLCRQCLGM